MFFNAQGEMIDAPTEGSNAPTPTPAVPLGEEKPVSAPDDTQEVVPAEDASPVQPIAEEDLSEGGQDLSADL